MACAFDELQAQRSQVQEREVLPMSSWTWDLPGPDCFYLSIQVFLKLQIRIKMNCDTIFKMSLHRLSLEALEEVELVPPELADEDVRLLPMWALKHLCR